MNLFKKSVIALCCAALFGCGSNDKPNQKSSTTAPTQTASTYIALTDIPYPPFEFSDGKSGLTGLEIELFDAIAKNQGFNVKYEPHPWNGIFETLNKHEATFVVSAVGITDEAKKEALISTPYMTSTYRVISLDKNKLNNWLKSTKIGVSEDEDAYEDVLADLGIKPEQLKMESSIFNTLTALARGDVDVVVADSSVFKYYTKSESFKTVASQFVSEELQAGDESSIAFAINKTHPELLTKVNQGLANLKDSGELDSILKKYNQ